MTVVRTLTVVAVLAAVAPSAAQQTTPRPAPAPKPPIADYRMDVATHSFAGMDPTVAAMAFGGRGDSNSFGMTRGGGPGLWLDLSLYTRQKPAGTQGTHEIPAGLQLGASLPLVPFAASRGGGEAPEHGERPKGRLLIYWGCGEAVRPGQPRILDMATATPEDFAKAFSGRFAPERGARAAPGHALWPNDRDRRNLPAGASLAGDHAVRGEGVPASLRFAVSQAHDFMPAVEAAAFGDLAGPVRLDWNAIAAARGWFAGATGAKGDDMIAWSSSEVPEAGFGLFDYLAPATVDRWIREKVLLAAGTQTCTVPTGIFAGADGAMARLIAYGPELNLVHPPRPANPNAAWEPEWAVRVRVKSMAMAMLGAEERPARRGGAPAGAPPARRDQSPPPSSSPSSNPFNILRGVIR